MLGSLIGALADYRTRVNADGGVVEALTCANSLDADVVMIPSGYKATKLYSQKAVPVYGAELVTNGDFATDTNGWLPNGNALISWDEGKALIDIQGSSGGIKTTINNFIIGKEYLVTADFNFITFSGSIGGDIGFGYEQTLNESGSLNFIFTATSTSQSIAFARTTTTTGTLTIDNVSVKEVLTGDCDFDVSRNSIATRVNKLGLIEEVAIDVPRLDYSDSNCPNLLLEPQSTNLLTYSEDFSDASWSKSPSVTLTLNDAVSPSGDIDATKLNFTSVASTHNLSYQYLTLAEDYTSAIYVKYIDTQFIQLWFGSSGFSGGNVNFDLINGTKNELSGATGKIESLSNGWYRISISKVSAGGTTALLAITTVNSLNSSRFGSEVDGNVYIWGAQAEALPYATSYIPTVGSTVTRIADNVTGSGDVNSFNDSEGVLFIEMASLFDSLSDRVISISDNTTSEMVYISYSSTTNQIAVDVVSGGVSQAPMTHTLTDETVASKIALKWKLNDCALWVDGVEVATDIVCTMPTGLVDLSFDDGNSANNMYCKLSALKVFTTALSDAQLETLTT